MQRSHCRALFHEGVGESLASYQRALTIRKRIAESNPSVTEFQESLAGGLLKIGVLHLDAGRLGEAVEIITREAAIREKLAEDNPSIPRYRSDLANCLNNAAALLLRLGRPSEARGRSERAVLLLEALAREARANAEYRWRLAEGYLRFGQAREAKGDHAGAREDWWRAVALLQTIPGLDDEYTFFHGCCHASLAGPAGQVGTGSSDALTSSEADRAMDLLKKAAGMGYRSVATFRNESALDLLRGREDFQLLMMDLAFPAKPFLGGL
jgi:tetratricopeptide (TPR) repeat protein